MGNFQPTEIMTILVWSSTVTFLFDTTVGEIAPSFVISILEIARRSSVGTVFNLTITAILITMLKAKEAKLLC